MARISKRFTFEAAHRLLRHNGQCRNLHGHSYKAEVVITGPVQESVLARELYQTSGKENPEAGMILDFSNLNKWWKLLEPKLDHMTVLEDGDELVDVLAPFVRMTVVEFTPTAENLAGWIRDDLSNWLLKQPGFGEGFPTPTVRVWETEKSWAEA